MQSIRTEAAPPAGGHYSQAVVHGGLVYVSGQLPIDAAGRRLQSDPVEAQTRQALQNLSAILEAAGSSIDRVLKVTVYVADIGLWDRVNGAYAEFFGEHRPARAVVPTGPLHFGLLVEIDAVAFVDTPR